MDGAGASIFSQRRKAQCNARRRDYTHRDTDIDTESRSEQMVSPDDFSKISLPLSRPLLSSCQPPSLSPYLMCVWVRARASTPRMPRDLRYDGQQDDDDCCSSGSRSSGSRETTRLPLHMNRHRFPLLQCNKVNVLSLPLSPSLALSTARHCVHASLLEPSCLCVLGSIVRVCV